MINPDFIKLWCKTCTHKQWKILRIGQVIITLDLERDEYEFKSECPDCKEMIYNNRKIK